MDQGREMQPEATNGPNDEPEQPIDNDLLGDALEPDDDDDGQDDTDEQPRKGNGGTPPPYNKDEAADRPDPVELERRIDVIMHAIVLGKSKRLIWRGVANKTTWGISSRTFDRYYARAMENIKRDSERLREHEVGKALARNDLVFKKAIGAADWRAALRANQQTTRLLGLDAPRLTRAPRDGDSDSPAQPMANVTVGGSSAVTINFIESAE